MKVESTWFEVPVFSGYLLSVILINLDVFNVVVGGINKMEIPTLFPGFYAGTGLLLFATLRSMGAVILKYQDDGDVMEFYMEHPLIKFTSGNLVKRYDFAKKSLVRYRVQRRFFRQVLELKMRRSGKTKGYKKAYIPITLLRKEEKAILLNSLDQILAENENG